MKLIILLIAFTFSTLTFGATCTSISRNNYTTNQVLTSSALNSDFNTVYAAANALDGGCVTDGTLESTALNSSQFGPVLKGIKEGCKVSYSSASQLSIGKCLAAVNGNFVATTAATTVSMACTSCSAEAASTVYYVYIATGSSGTTLNLLILTTAPNEDGYDDSGNKVIGRFYNNAASDISEDSIAQWTANQFSYDSNMKTCRYAFGGAAATLASPTECTTGTCVEVYDSCGAISPPSWAATGTYTNITIANGTFANSTLLECECEGYDATAGPVRECHTYFDTSDQMWSTNSSGGAVINLATYAANGTGADGYVRFTCKAKAP